jgi:hypothetical protein
MKERILILFLLIGKIGFAQIPSIDPTAIQRLIELKNTVATLKKGLALQKNIDTNTMGDEANSTALVEAQGKIEDFLRDSDEYIRLSFNNTAYSDLNNLSRFSQNLKSNISNNLNSSTWKVNDLQAYLMGTNYSANSGSEFYDVLTKGISLDNKQGTNNINGYYDNLSKLYNRQYALQTVMQKKKIQQALTYYKMADELEAKAMALNEGMKSQTAGKPFTLQNKGVFGLNKSTDTGGLFDDLFSSNSVELPNFTSSGVIKVNGQNYVLDATGNVYDDKGNFITQDLGFGAKEQAMEAFLKDNPNLKSAMGNAFDELMANPFGLIGSLFKGGPKTPQVYLDEIIKQRMEAKVQNQANAVQTEIYNNILKTAFEGRDGNYSGLLNSLNFTSSSFGTKSGLRISTGERIAGNKFSIDLITKAQELREKADALVFEALKRTDEQKQLDAVWQKEMIRKSLIKMTL